MSAFHMYNAPLRRAVVRAEDFAKKSGSEVVDDTHFLLALASDDDVCELALKNLGYKPEATVASYERLYCGRDSNESRVTRLPFTEGLKQVVAAAHAFALKASKDFVGTEHYLFALYSQANPGFGVTFFFPGLNASTLARVKEVAANIQRFGVENTKLVFAITMDEVSGELVIPVPKGASIIAASDYEDGPYEMLSFADGTGEVRVSHHVN